MEVFAYVYFACEKLIRQLDVIYSSHSALQQFKVRSWMTLNFMKAVWYKGLFVFERIFGELVAQGYVSKSNLEWNYQHPLVGQ